MALFQTQYRTEESHGDKNKAKGKPASTTPKTEVTKSGPGSNQTLVDQIVPSSSVDETFLRFLSCVTFTLFCGLFVIQACFLWDTYKNLHGETSSLYPRLTPPSSEIFFSSDRSWKFDAVTGELRVNTSCFVS